MQAETTLESIINNIQFVYKPVSQSFDLVLSSGTINAEKQALQLTKPPEQLRPNVIASLERSLDENADIWAELSRH